MRMMGKALIVMFACAMLVVSADAQRRRRPAPKPTPTPVVTAEVRAAKEKVSNQIANVDRFVSVLRPIATGIQSVDADIKAKKASQKAIAANDANKKKLVQAISGLHQALSSLEAEFQTKPALRKYLLKIEGISGFGAQSEDLAVAGRFGEADRPLVNASARLRNTLAAMP